VRSCSSKQLPQVILDISSELIVVIFVLQHFPVGTTYCAISPQVTRCTVHLPQILLVTSTDSTQDIWADSITSKIGPHRRSYSYSSLFTEHAKPHHFSDHKPPIIRFLAYTSCDFICSPIVMEHALISKIGSRNQTHQSDVLSNRRHFADAGQLQSHRGPGVLKQIQREGLIDP